MDADLVKQLQKTKAASRKMLLINTETKNKALLKIADGLLENRNLIIEENTKDIIQAQNNGLSQAMIDRLLLDEKRIQSIVEDIRKLTQLNDPIGEVMREIQKDNGLIIKQVRVPIGVFGIIYESRPNVTVDIACLCIKSGNVCVLKGGKEAYYSNKILTKIMNESIKGLLPEGTIYSVDNMDRSIVKELICANDYIDVVVPRGGKGLIDFVVSNATVPVIETGAGVCHLYVDQYADLKMAIEIAKNAKMQRPSVCNAIETILVHESVAREFLDLLSNAFKDKVEIRGNQSVARYIDCVEMSEEDYHNEYGDYIVSVKVVKDIDEAIQHIYTYSTHHSETIVTLQQEQADYFMAAVDSACVYHNASTRFSDGSEFGFGAELGISTQKLHARGPLALQEMTSYQYKIYGEGQIRE